MPQFRLILKTRGGDDLIFRAGEVQQIFLTKEGDDEPFCPKISSKASTFLDIFTISAAPKNGTAAILERKEGDFG